jgi:hypothetical protein
MTVTIDLPPETEAKLREQAAKEGAKLEEYLSQLAHQWASANGTGPKSVALATEKTPEQRVAEFLAWANSHAHITAVADDSRESFYEGRGE